MRFAKNQLDCAKLLLPEMDPLVSQELEQLLKMTSVTRRERAAFYEQWEEQCQKVQMLGEDQTYPISQLLMDVFNQGRVSDLLASLERLMTFGIKPTLQELAEFTLELVKRPWPLSRLELEVLNILHEDPTASTAQISQALGYHRQTVAGYLRRLHFALQISTYPIVNFHALGLRRFQIWFRGTMEVPKSVYFYSRLSAAGTRCQKGWLLDTWSVPEGGEDLFLERYHQMEQTRQIHDLSVREILSFGKHLSLSTYNEGSGWRSDPEVVKLVYERALAGQDSHIPRLLEVMVYATIKSHMVDTIDIGIIEELWKDYLLGQTRANAAFRLGISRSTFSRRLRQLELNGVIKPSLWLKTENMVLTALTIPIEETQVLNALMCLPVVYFYLTKSNKGNYWFVVVKSPPAVASVITDSTLGDKNGVQTYSLQIIDQKNGKRIFKAFDTEFDSWNHNFLID